LSTAEFRRKVSVADILARKRRDKFNIDKRKEQRIVAITSYDYPTALIADRAKVDIILVGDSAGMVVLGYSNTKPVTLEEMLIMCSAVSRGSKGALLVGDMPFMSYQVSIEDAIRNAGMLIKDGGVDAVKIEGGREFAPTVRALVQAGIPVMGHIGFTPQTTPILEGYKVQGKTADAALDLIDDARALEEAGVFSIVLEMTTSEVANMITNSLKVPTIGIGAGSSCDGQILVLHDVLGLYDKFTPKFAKRYANLSPEIQRAIEDYLADVIDCKFPAEEHTFHMEESELEKLRAKVATKANFITR
jgi:3-methyl-2-oxobutanoate hydroxymethyltransferase